MLNYDLKTTTLKYCEYSNEINQLYNSDRYISFNDNATLLKKFQNLDLRRLNQLRLFLLHAIRFQVKTAFKVFRAISNIRIKISNRENYNREFIKQERQKSYICDDQTLDPDQIEAVVACEDAQLVLAPAGSGKTISLVTKIAYLVNTLRMQPHEILAVSFTRKSVKELRERIGRIGISKLDIHTFHSLGNRILKDQLAEKKEIIQEKHIQKFIKESLDDLIASDEKFAQSFNDYLLFYFSTPIDLTELQTLRETIEFNKSFLRETLQSISLKKECYDKTRPTLKGEFIKSKEEQIIANWLYINQIPYEYERQYKYIDTKYRPDFTLTLFQEPIYLEHFALRKDGTSHLKNYVKGVMWKRKLHETNGTILLESYSHQWTDGTLLKHIERNIKRNGVTMSRLAEHEITNLLSGSNQYSSDIKSFRELLFTFLMLQKNGMLSIENVSAKISNIQNAYLKRRSLLFFEIYRPIYERYDQFLKTNKLIDFADMINRSVEIVENSSRENRSYKYILIDEAQDLSYNRYRLISSLLKSNPNSKLFAVGDDWQSIYRFAGGDLSLIQDFEHTFKLTTRRSFISMTHRFGNPQLQMSSAFVQKNPYQSQKNVFGSQLHNTPILKRFYTSKYNNSLDNMVSEEAMVVDSILNEITKEYGESLLKKQLQIVSRYNWDIDSIIGNHKKGITRHNNFTISKSDNDKEEDNDLILEWKSEYLEKPIKIPFCSMHKAKGITRDIVIILNMNAGMNGMPSLHTSDPLVEMFLSHADQFPFAEERRLFYVSITRAREKTFVIADKSRPSQFLFEIFDDIFEDGQICPTCQIGEITERSGVYGKFYSCSNFRYGCDYKRSYENT